MKPGKPVWGKISSALLLIFAANVCSLTVSGDQSERTLRLVAGEAAAQAREDGDRTLSPYFFVKGSEDGADRLPLKSTAVSVDIAGTIADVKVAQVYRNEGQRPIEAVYVFPGSTKAAVYGMKMTIGERTIIADVRRREDARREYEQAKQEGKSASLLEQQRPNVFRMNVANILPGDSIRVELSYTELLTPADKVYEFVYPTVVGPRYSGRKAENSASAGASRPEEWIHNPYLHQGEPPTSTFDIVVNLSAGLPIQEMTCGTHKVGVSYTDSSRARVSLAPGERFGGNRDYILRYRLAGGLIESGLLLYEGNEENFFLLNVQPSERVASVQIPPREYIFIIDVSGSMIGFPLDISKKLLKDLISNLTPEDRFNVLLFAGGASVLSERSLPATSENVRKALDVIDRQQGGGGTELLPALKRALALPRAEEVCRTIVVATDGYVTVEEEAFDLIRRNLGDANLFAFGIGSSVNRFIIEGMARAGMGEPFVVTRPEEAAAKADGLRKMIQSPVLTRIKVEFDGFDAFDVEPTAIPDLMADRPLTIFGKWRGKPGGTIKLSGITGGRPYDVDLDVASAKPLESNAALRYLWARHRIAVLSDYNTLRADEERVIEITNLGLKYSLLTAYTSFVAVDSKVRRENGKLEQVIQPLPLPEGVSDYAVGVSSLRAAPMSTALGRIAEAPESLGFRSKQQIFSRDEAAPSGGEARERIEQEKWVHKGSGPVIKIEKVVVSGALSEASVLQVLEPHLEQIVKCRDSSAQSLLPERFTAEWTVGSAGRVTGVKISASRALARDFAKCVRELVMRWRFPASTVGAKTKVIASFAFDQR